MMVKPPPPSSSSSKQGQVHRVGVSMENHNNINNNNKSKQEPRLSGAYIRSLVKHLTTSIKSKDSFNGDHDTLPESLNSTAVSHINDNNNNNNNNNMHQQSLPLPLPPPPPHKKQVRRRQQTSKPYQERLLNMAEARREIVTALKFHRASMKQRQTANNNRLPDQSPSPYPSSLSCSPSVPHFWPIPTTTPPHVHENLDFTLPNQTLGLNLNFHDFKNLDANLYLNYSTTSSASSSSSRSTSSTAAISLVTEQMEQMAADIPEEESRSTSSTAAISLVTEQVGQMAADIPEEEVVATTSSSATSTTSSSMSLHHAMDDEGMEEIRSLGEQHQLEWDDTVNLLMSARWFKFLNTFEMEQEDGKFEQVMEFPYCMDIGEIEGMDGEWLA